jgi:hypothetical protein
MSPTFFEILCNNNDTWKILYMNSARIKTLIYHAKVYG